MTEKSDSALEILFYKVNADGQPAGPNEQFTWEGVGLFNGIQHSRVYALLASLHKPEQRPKGLPVPKGQATLHINGYKRPGDRDWHDWSQTLFSEEYQSPRGQGGKKVTTQEPEVKQGVELRDSRDAMVQPQARQVGVGGNFAHPKMIHHGAENGVVMSQSPCANGGC